MSVNHNSCPKCGATITDPTPGTYKCEYCGSTLSIERDKTKKGFAGVLEDAIYTIKDISKKASPYKNIEKAPKRPKLSNFLFVILIIFGFGIGGVAYFFYIKFMQNKWDQKFANK